MKFKQKLLEAARRNRSWLCVGLDPDISLIPSHLGKDLEAILKFNQAVIESTSDLVCSFKPNAAFYEFLGPKGWEILGETVRMVPHHIPVILDFKRGDIGNTAKMYAASAFETIGADAVTVNPFLGKDSIEPFLEYAEKGIFVLCLTSNPSSADFQKKMVMLEEPPSVEGLSPQSKARAFAEFFCASAVELYVYLARSAVEWNRNDNIGLVVGATSPLQLEGIRGVAGDDMPILIPGVGAQGGDLEQALAAGSNMQGELAIINVSRSVIYAGKGEDFDSEVRRAAEGCRDRISEALLKKTRYRA
jgi:orotidine-5'-phosphate decarboxylase